MGESEYGLGTWDATFRVICVPAPLDRAEEFFGASRPGGSWRREVGDDEGVDADANDSSVLAWQERDSEWTILLGGDLAAHEDSDAEAPAGAYAAVEDARSLSRELSTRAVFIEAWEAWTRYLLFDSGELVESYEEGVSQETRFFSASGAPAPTTSNPYEVVDGMLEREGCFFQNPSDDWSELCVGDIDSFLRIDAFELPERPRRPVPESTDEDLLDTYVDLNCFEDVRRLLDQGVSIETYSPHGIQPIHTAAEAGHTHIIEMLLEAGADIEARTLKWGYTPLHLAACQGFVDVVEFLLSRGARPDARSSEGSTPADLAREDGHEDLAKLLESRSDGCC